MSFSVIMSSRSEKWFSVIMSLRKSPEQEMEESFARIKIEAEDDGGLISCQRSM